MWFNLKFDSTVLKRFLLLCILKIVFGQLEELDYIAHIKIRLTLVALSWTNSFAVRNTLPSQIGWTASVSDDVESWVVSCFRVPS